MAEGITLGIIRTFLHSSFDEERFVSARDRTAGKYDDYDWEKESNVFQERLLWVHGKRTQRA